VLRCKLELLLRLLGPLARRLELLRHLEEGGGVGGRKVIESKITATILKSKHAPAKQHKATQSKVKGDNTKKMQSSTKQCKATRSKVKEDNTQKKRTKQNLCRLSEILFRSCSQLYFKGARLLRLLPRGRQPLLPTMATYCHYC